MLFVLSLIALCWAQSTDYPYSFDLMAREFAERHAHQHQRLRSLDSVPGFAGQFTSDDDDDGSHECIHSTLRAARRRKREALGQSINATLTQRVRTIADSLGGKPGSEERRRAARDLGMFTGIRIFFDTSAVNDERACRAISQETRDEIGNEYTCTADDILTPEKAEFLTSVLEQANVYLQNALAVLPIDGASLFVLLTCSQHNKRSSHFEYIRR